MKIKLQSEDVELMQQVANALASELEQADLNTALQSSALQRVEDTDTVRGDGITLAAIFLTAVGAGGALTVAMSKNGFLTRLAQVLEKLVERRIDVAIETEDGKTTRLSGPAAQIRKLLSEIKPEERHRTR